MASKVIDLHCDSVFSLMDKKDLRGYVPEVQVDVPRLKAGNVGLQVFAAYVPPPPIVIRHSRLQVKDLTP